MFEQEPADQPNHATNDPGEETAPASSEFADAMRERPTILPIPDVGQRLHATIQSIGEETTFLDYGGRSEATMETRHLRSPDGEILASPGERIEAYVVANEEAVVLAPAMEVPAAESLSVLREAHANGLPVAGKVTAMNAGGLEVNLAGNRAFCPVSQVDIGYCPDASVFVGKTLDFKLLEFGEMGRRIVVSRRALLLQEREAAAARVRDGLKVGEERDGTVARMESFGAFIDLGGIDGLVHVSEISHERINQPSEALKIGDKVRVRILEIGKDAKGRDRISLSIKAALEDPWIRAAEEIHEGQTFTGRVMRKTEFGLFIRLMPGVEGLLHISEIGPRRDEGIKEGQEIEVRVQKIEMRRKRISLALRDQVAVSGPRVGERCEGVIRAHKPYGVFIDLPSFGPRASGLLPLEETGVPRGGDLSRQYPAGGTVEVLVQQIDEKGRIRLAIPTAATGPTQQSASRGTSGAMADALRRALESREKTE
jgi:small subunit ribosomal protein S1